MPSPVAQMVIEIIQSGNLGPNDKQAIAAALGPEDITSPLQVGDTVIFNSSVTPKHLRGFTAIVKEDLLSRPTIRVEIPIQPGIAPSYALRYIYVPVSHIHKIGG